MHSHPDQYISTCAVCQRSIREIKKAGKELAKMGVWNIPKKVKDGIEYTIWESL